MSFWSLTKSRNSRGISGWLGLWILVLMFPNPVFAGAQKGVLDLSSRSFENGETAQLDGDWEFYPLALLKPEDLNGKSAVNFFPMPSTWSKVLGTCCGYATYKLLVKAPRTEGLGLEISYMSTAAKIWVNGQDFFSSGTVGTDESTSIPSRYSAILPLPRAEFYEIVVQISNFHHARGGTWRSFRFGKLAELDRQTRLQQLFEMTIIGGIFSIGIYHLALFFLRREKFTIAFSLCCFAVGFRLSSVGDRVMEMIFAHIPWGMMFRIEYLTLYLSPPLIWFYIQQLFPQDIHKIYMRIVWVISLGFACSLALPSLMYTQMINAFLLFSTSVSLSMLVVTIRAVILKRTAARTIAIGGLCIIVSACIDIVNMLVFSEYQMFFFHVGFLIFIICQSFAIAQIYNKYFLNLVREESMRRHSYNQLAKVFYPHQLNRMQAGDPLELTMPTGQGNACVVAFDIVGSSRIEHIHVKSFLESSIKHCLSIIGEGYDPELLTATGYRIKEVGDGFLCSVGYPFRTPNEENLANSSVRLALRFVEIFQDEVIRFSYAEPIHCCIGIAYDSIEGYFPSSGTLEYDIYGRSVILATRYEGIRHSIFPDGVPASLIILQRKVWMSLDEDLRNRFVAFDLEAAKIQVRDDRDAKFLYYIALPSPA